MTPATILHEAEVELWNAVAYYEDKSPGLGLDFEAEVELSVDTVKRFPEYSPLREDGTRRCLIHRFPYLVVYMYLSERIWIIAIAHCKRKPSYWTDRIKTAEHLAQGDSE